MPLFRKRFGSRKLVTIVCPLFFVAGIVIFSYGTIQLYYAYQSNFWPNTRGIIQQSNLTHKKGVTRTKGRSQSGKFHAEIEYAYVVGGATFRNSNIFFGYNGGKTSFEAKELISKYPAGNKVTVYYREGNPALSILRPGIHRSTWQRPMIGLLLLLVGILGYWRGRR